MLRKEKTMDGKKKKPIGSAADVERAAEQLLARLGEPSDPKNREIETSMLALQHALWGSKPHE